MNRKVWAILLAAGIISSPVWAMKPVTVVDQGSFMVGGTVITAPGVYKDNEPTDYAGKTMHGDAAYVAYQIPKKARHNGIVFLHGYGQSGKSWETTPDGRDGFQNIFLEKGWTVYIVDEPRRGRGGQSTVPVSLKAVPQDQLWFNNFRMGRNNTFYDNVTFPKSEEALHQFYKQMVPDTGAFNINVVTEAMDALFDRIGDGILVTHSAGGGPGWMTAIRNSRVKGVISLEPGTFPFPEKEAPAVEETTSPFPAVPMIVSDEEFEKITKIPVVVYFGDNIPSGGKPVENWGQDNWRVRKNMAERWAEVVNAHGGDVTVVSLPDKGIKGNTHFMMADLNNKDVADDMERWMKEKGLAK